MSIVPRDREMVLLHVETRSLAFQPSSKSICKIARKINQFDHSISIMVSAIFNDLELFIGADRDRNLAVRSRV